MPSGAIHEQDGVSAVGDVARYLVQMQLHGFGIGVGNARAAPVPRAGQIAPNR